MSGALVSVALLRTIDHFGRGHQIIWIIASSLIAVGLGAWLGHLRCTQVRLIAYPCWGFILSIVTGLIGTIEVFYTYRDNLNNYSGEVQKDGIYFLICVTLAFTTGAFATDTGRVEAQTATGGSKLSVALVATLSILANAATFAGWSLKDLIQEARTLFP